MRRRIWIPAALLLAVAAVAVWAGWFLSLPSVTGAARVAALDALAAELDSIPSAGTLIVVDFTKPSRMKRLGVLDLATGAWIRHARVAHGRNSGLVYARDLSDEPGSLKSSGGLFAVGESFDGIHGVSLRLFGLEPGRNGNAEDRGIIVHAAEYAGLSTVFANWRERFRLGRSEGCFAVTPSDYGNLLHDLRRPAFLYAFDGIAPAPRGAAPPTLPTRADAARERDLAAARALFERNLDAIRNEDAAAYLACYWKSESLTRNGPGGVSTGFEEWAAEVGSGWPTVFDASPMRLTWLRPGVVYGSYRYRVRFEEGEETGISERVFVETGDGWKITVTTAFPAPAGQAPPPVALVGATALRGGDAPLVDAVVLVRDGAIECVGSREACVIPGDAEVVELTGAWILAGGVGGLADPASAAAVAPGLAADLVVLSANPRRGAVGTADILHVMSGGELRPVAELGLGE